MEMQSLRQNEPLKKGNESEHGGKKCEGTDRGEDPAGFKRSRHRKTGGGKKESQKRKIKNIESDPRRSTKRKVAADRQGNTKASHSTRDTSE